MDNRSLSHGTAVILSAYLPYVRHGSLPAAGDQAAWETAARLWRTLREPIERASQAGHPLERGKGQGVIPAADTAADNPTGENLARLAGLLAELFEAYPSLASHFETTLLNSPFAAIPDSLGRNASPEDLMQEYQKQHRLISTMRGHPATESASPSRPVPACQMCGRQDASLQVVSYPFVMSLVVVTFRRAFTGIWCWRHAALWRTIASLITVTVGWLGVPFGLIFTPSTLFTLAKGGNRPADINQQMLMDLATYKQKTENNYRQAVECLEAALEYGKTPALEARLRELYALYPEAARSGASPKLIVFPAVLIIAGLIGLVIGMIDYLVTSLYPLLGDSVSFIILILTWVPFVALLFLGGLLISQMVGAAMAWTRTHQKALGGALGILATGIMIYAVPSGTFLTGTIADPSFAGTLGSITRMLATLGMALVWGGEYTIENTLILGNTSDAIYLVLLLGMGFLSIVSSLSITQGVAERQRLGNDFRAEAAAGYSSSMVAGWLAVVGSVFVCIALFVVALFTSQFQYGGPAIMERATQALTLLDEGDLQGAKAVVEEAKAIDSGAFMTYLTQSVVELTADNCDEALSASEAAIPLAPPDFQWAAYTTKSEAYFCMYQIDDGIAVLEAGDRVNPGSREILTRLGMSYYGTGRFDKAEETLLRAVEADPEWAPSYAGLALLYYTIDQPDKEKESLEKALSYLKDDASDYLDVASYYGSKRDFAEAEKHLRKALELSPKNPTAMTQLAGVLAIKKDFDEATKLLDTVLAGQISRSDAYIAKADNLVEQEKLDEALQELANAESLRDDEPWVPMGRGYIYLYQGDYEAAVTAANLSIERFKYNSSGYAVLALAYQAMDRQDEALAAAQKALELAPKYDTPHYVMGVYYMKKGDKAAATAEFKTFLELTWDRAYIKDMQAQARDYLAQP